MISNEKQILAVFLQACPILFCVTLFANAAYALHEIDHRFTISGYVRDDMGEAQSGQNVVVKDAAGGTLGKATSGPTGFYSIRLHLHSEDVGMKLEVSTETRTQEAQVKFDPDNVKDERTVEVHFGAEPVATPLWESPTVLAVSATGIAGAVIYLFMSKRRKRLNRAPQGGRPRKKRKK